MIKFNPDYVKVFEEFFKELFPNKSVDEEIVKVFIEGLLMSSLIMLTKEEDCPNGTKAFTEFLKANPDFSALVYEKDETQENK